MGRLVLISKIFGILYLAICLLHQSLRFKKWIFEKDLSGTTIVKMKDGKVLKEQDFFDNYSFMKQLGLIE